ncbi:MAG: DUF6807 family protein [Planctomycetota bacterium]
MLNLTLQPAGITQAMKIVSLSLIALLWTVTPSLGQSDRTQFVGITCQDGLTILDGIHPVLTYQSATKSKAGKWPRANYVHPLYDLDGEVLTEDFPADHGHHRGVFWAWHQVIVDGQQIGDAWTCQDFAWEVVQLRPSRAPGLAMVEAVVNWKSPKLLDDESQPIPIAEEKVQIRVHESEERYRVIDFDLRLKALLPQVQIGGSNNEKGYGGFSPRIKLTEDLVFSGSGGEVEPTKTALQVGPWVNVSNSQRGLAIMTHPKNPGEPDTWILRRAKSMQNPSYPGQHPVELPVDKAIRLQYRLVIHRGNLSAEELNELHADFAK